MHTVPSQWNQAFVRGPIEIAEKTCKSAASNSEREMLFLASC